MSKVSAAILSFGLGFFLFVPTYLFWSWHDQPTVGIALPQGAAVFETSLQSRISSTDTSMTLVANSVRGGSALSGYNCFTIDEGRSDMEYVCGTVSGTSVTGLERGVDPLTASTTNSALKFAHRVGANVKITDFPLIQRMRHQLSGTDTIANIIRYAFNPTFASTSDIVTKKYVDDTAFSGAAVIDATTGARGVVELATPAEIASTTANGGSGVLVIPASAASSSPTASCVLCIPVAVNGKLSNSWMDTVNIEFGAISYFLPQGAPTASSSVLAVNGTAPYRLSWQPRMLDVHSSSTNTTTNTSTTTLRTVTVPANTLGMSNRSLRINAVFTATGASNECPTGVLFGNGSSTSTIMYFNGYGSSNAIANANIMIYAPTPNIQKIIGHGFSMDGDLAAGDGTAPRAAVNATYNLANTTYIAFVTRSTTGPTCGLAGDTVEILTY